VVPRRAVFLVALAGCGRLGFEPVVDGGDPDGDDPSVLRIRSVAMGLSTVCAVSNRGEAKCWGLNEYGKLGIGAFNTDAYGDEPGERAGLPLLDLGTGAVIEQLSFTADFGCALLAGRAVKCWGNGDGAQLGRGTYDTSGDEMGEMGDNLQPVILPSGAPVDEVVTGHYHACVRRDGAVQCWGINDVDQNGYGDRQPMDSPQKMAALPNVDLGAFSVARLFALFNATCALDASGRVKCWGYNVEGSLGIGDTMTRGDDVSDMGDALPFVDLGPGVTVQQMDCGWGHCCAVTSGGLKCWGQNPGGALGTADSAPRGDSPGEMGAALLPIDAGGIVVQVSAGARHTCARFADGDVACFGANNRGQLGIGSVDDRGDGPDELGTATLRVTLPERAVHVESGGEASCAILASGAIACWGKNDRGDLGNGSSSDVGDMPGELPFVTTAAELFPN
jgi:alpha-tubulin suppressor-like RCC1 family protein